MKAVKSGKAKNVREALQRESAAEAENGEESELPPCLRVFLNAPAPKLSKGQQQASSSIKRHFRNQGRQRLLILMLEAEWPWMTEPTNVIRSLDWSAERRQTFWTLCTQRWGEEML